MTVNFNEKIIFPILVLNILTKLKKNFPLYSNPSYGSELKIDEIEDWTSSIYLNAGYNTWNISLEYDLNPLIKNKKTIDGNNLNVSFFRLGLIFYIL